MILDLEMMLIILGFLWILNYKFVIIYYFWMIFLFLLTELINIYEGLISSRIVLLFITLFIFWLNFLLFYVMISKGEIFAFLGLLNGMIGGTILVLPLLAIQTGYLLIPCISILYGSISYYTCYLIVLHLG